MFIGVSLPDPGAKSQAPEVRITISGMSVYFLVLSRK
jgi:hypothetical protein